MPTISAFFRRNTGVACCGNPRIRQSPQLIYVLVYRRTLDAIEILNVLHSRQQYPK
jgi:plasmid stabilization system protein ParE